MNIFMTVLFICLCSYAHSDSADNCGSEASSCFTYGAKIFQNRCTLCHGNDGLGEGILSLSVKNYPNTNLLLPKFGVSFEQVAHIVRYGVTHKSYKDKSRPISEEMPLWGDELTIVQLKSVVKFVLYLRTDTEKAMPLLRKMSADITPTKRVGRGIFKGRCALCHGLEGLGNGKMSRIIKDPPPYNLTLSRMPDSYLTEIIYKGGQAIGRSSRMPPFGEDLTESEIASVILYIKSLRE